MAKSGTGGGTGKVASRYAKAIFETALQSNDLDAVLADIKTLDAAFTGTPSFYTYLENPAVSQQEKSELLASVSQGDLHPLVKRLLALLLENKRLAAFHGVTQELIREVNRHNQTVTADVVTASELDSSTLDRLRQALASQFGYKHVEVEHRVDPGLLGGVVIRLEDQVIDGSYIGRLEDLRRQVAKA